MKRVLQVDSYGLLKEDILQKNAKLYAENSSIPVEKVYKAHTVIFFLQFLIKLKGELHLRRNLCHFILRL